MCMNDMRNMCILWVVCVLYIWVGILSESYINLYSRYYIYSAYLSKNIFRTFVKRNESYKLRIIDYNLYLDSPPVAFILEFARWTKNLKYERVLNVRHISQNPLESIFIDI